MTGKIQFRFDVEKRVLFARPVWDIETEKDCEDWAREWVSALKPFSRKVDCVLLLDAFKIDRKVAKTWSDYRARMAREFFRFSYRVNPELSVSTAALTGGVKYNAATNEAATEADAVAAILAEREQVGGKEADKINWETLDSILSGGA